ncbi:MAG: hypothetical protein ACREDR_16930, partial [Blastocatellia bacterium]
DATATKDSDFHIAILRNATASSEPFYFGHADQLPRSKEFYLLCRSACIVFTVCLGKLVSSSMGRRGFVFLYVR